MGAYSDRYGNDEPDYHGFRVPSTIEFPSMDQADPNPGGTLDSIPNAVIAGYGPDDEFLMPDGTATTRFKSQTGNQRGGGVDGGTP